MTFDMKEQIDINTLKQAAEQGDTDSIIKLAIRYAKGQDVEKNFQKAIQLLKNAAELGSANAKIKLGILYKKGQWGEKRDPQASEHYFNQAKEQLEKDAAHGDVAAKIRSALTFAHNPNIKDEQAALKWYRKAAEEGSAKALCELGQYYMYGSLEFEENPEKQDKREAFNCYRKAADMGYPEAYHDLAFCYLYGRGVEKDEAEAHQWLLKAAEQGDIRSQLDLARNYKVGWHRAPKDPQAAAMWGAKAIEQLTQKAEQGDAHAQWQLASCYCTSIYGAENKQEAIKWYAKAAAQGDRIAQQCLDELTSPVKAFFKRLFRRY